MKADKIIFLEDGMIKDIGTHDELLNRSEDYKNIFELETCIKN